MDKVRESFHTTTTPIDYTTDVRETSCLEASRRNALNNLTIALREVSDLEAKLGLTVPLSPQHPKYQETLRYIQKWDFHRALDRVQALVVQRLFEMSKAGMAGTGWLREP